MNTFLRLMLVIIILASSSFVSAVSCGDDISSNLTLTEDLHCISGYTALNVVSSDVTINLNGYKISGNTKLAGITLNGVINVSIYEGSITDFFAGINAARSSNIEIRNISFFETGHGVVFHQVNKSSIENNDFIKTRSIAINIYNTETGETSQYNSINKNEFYKANGGIRLCGAGTKDNNILDNLILKSSDYAIDLAFSSNNQINQNTILETSATGIRLNSSSDNKLSGNYLNNGTTGVSLLSEGGSSICETTGASASARNEFEHTSIFNFNHGMIFGLGTSTWPSIYYNNMTNSKIYDNTVGVLFQSDAWINDLSGATIVNNSTNIIDNGTSNIF